MKLFRILPALTGIAVAVVMLGCSDLGSQIATILPSNGGSAVGSTQLSESGDTDAIDPSQIGGGNSSMAQLEDHDASGINGFNDGPMNEEYSEMMGNFDDDMAMDGMEDGGAIMGADDEKAMMQLDNPTDGLEGGPDSDMTAQMNMLEPADLGAGEGTPGYLESLGGGLLEPPLGDFGGEQSLGGFGVGVGGMEKPASNRGPQKQLPSKNPKLGPANIRDRPSQSTENKPFGATNNSPNAAMRPNSQNPRTDKSTTKPIKPAAGIKVPGNITNPAYTLINSVAVPVLSQNGTVMTFSTEILQQRNRSSRGTVYCVVHSQQLGFVTSRVSPAGGRINIGSKFTPTSGPFKVFIVELEANGELKYLSSAANIQGNP